MDVAQTLHPESRHREIAIIGAGIVGVATALQLRLNGHHVVLIDPAGVGQGCSKGNMGILSPDACLPMAAPGMLRHIPGWLTDPAGPLAIRWSHLPKLLPWLLRFTQRMKSEIQLSDAHILRNYLVGAYEAYEPLLKIAKAEHLIGPGRYLTIYASEARWQAEQASIALRRRLGVRLEELSAEAVREAEPALEGPVARGLLNVDTHYCRSPERLVELLFSAFSREGGQLLRERVLSCRSSGRSVELHTNAGTHRPELVVVAAGAHSAGFARQVGDRVPLAVQRGYHAMLPNASIDLTNAVTFIDGKVVLTPMENGLRIGGSVEFAGLGSKPNWDRARQMPEIGKRLLGNIDTTDVTYWAGDRPCLPDSIPVISRSKRCEGMIYAFGHGHLGLTGAALTARLVTELVEERPLPAFASGLRHDRF